MEIFRQGSQQIAAGASATLITFWVPRGNRLSLKEFGNYANAIGAFGNVVWRVKINGSARYPLDSISDQVGSQNQTMPIGNEIEAYGGDLVEVTAENALTAPQPYGAGAIIKGDLVGVR